jgi:hypothetical protein
VVEREVEGDVREGQARKSVCGTEDFARTYDENRANLMRNSPYFAETANEQNGNFAFHLKQGYSHDGRAAMEYTFNGLRWFWNG